MYISGLSYDNLLNFYILFSMMIFYFIEKHFPERKIDYRREFANDFLAFLSLLILGPLVVTPLMTFYRKLNYVPFHFLEELSPLSRILLSSLTTDFFNYWVHWSMHKFNWYWRSHLFHHRVQNLYWFSGLRASIVHYISFIVVRITVGCLIFRLNAMELFYYFAIGFTFNSYQHTNSKTGHKFIEWIIVTPRIHRLHHSSSGRRMKNIGTVFTFWDRLFGTYLDPDEVDSYYDLGIKNDLNKNWIKEFLGI